ncbi:MAG: hypothetical protein JSV59_05985 [Flavobacteriaceae bacterium]|nr:MAG: hypothetical protein JSV59_05985 [Flavobacteriaceae bacterium]
MSNAFDYLKFWFKATNQHGIHSPFIYRFVTKGLYDKHKYSRSKSLNTFLKCINYFNPNSIDFEAGNELIRNKVKEQFPSLSFEGPFDMKFFGGLKTESQVSAMEHYAEQHPAGIIYIDNISKNKNSKEIWNKLILADFVIVSVDLYFGGLLFFHKTQAKEHFKIRI